MRIDFICVCMRTDCSAYPGDDESETAGRTRITLFPIPAYRDDINLKLL
jgi:hypothetical protein